MAAKPRIIPVLDVVGGVVVRAVAGRRAEYRPVKSKLTGGIDPITIAATMLATSNANEIYVADLDAIAGRSSISPAVLELLAACHRTVWLDVGLGKFKRVSMIPAEEHLRPVIGFETCGTPDAFTPHEREMAFSIDLRDGRLVGDWQAWELEDERDAMGLARKAVRLGARTLIVLDLARVGTGNGSGTEALLRAIADEFPGVELIAGGGVKTWADVDALGEAGADAVLVASAIHDGTLTFPRPAS